MSEPDWVDPMILTSESVRDIAQALDEEFGIFGYYCGDPAHHGPWRHRLFRFFGLGFPLKAVLVGIEIHPEDGA